MNALEGRKAIVTGAARGLGEAIVLRLACEGCDVLVADIDETAAEKTASRIAGDTGRTVVHCAVDITDEDRVRAMVAVAVKELGGVDILVSNAGILVSGDSTKMSVEDWRKVVDVNLTGYFLCAREVAKEMLEAGSGVIIQINSKSGKKGSYKNAPYISSKFGGIGLTQSLALEWAEQGIRVNAVCPGNLLDSPLWVNSLYRQYAERLGITEEQVRQKYIDQVPMKRGCTYDDVTGVVVFLASDESKYMTGQAINVTGGQEMR